MQELNRVSIGFRVPPDVQQKLADAQLALKHKGGGDVVRWVPPSELQLTIMHLGEISLYALEQVKTAIGSSLAVYHQMNLNLEGLAGSPNNLQPRFVWTAVTGDVEELTKIHNHLERLLMHLLREYNAKPFVPHLDLGRIKIESEHNRTALGRAIKMVAMGMIGSFRVDKIELMRAVTTSAGPSLELLQAYPLAP